MKILKSYLGKLEKNKRTLLYRVVFVTSALVVGGVLVSFLTSDATAGWWDEGWLHRKQINFGNSGSPQSNKIVSFTEDTATLIADGKMQTGCQDVRFVDNTGRPLEHRIGYQPDIQYVPGSATEYNSTTGASSYTFSHTVNSGSNQLLTVIVHAQDTAAINVTNVTFNSDSMTEQIEVDHNDGTNHYVTSIWTLVNPDVTSANVQVTYSASVDRHVASAMNFTGVDQTTPVGVVESNTSSSASSIGITDTTSYANSVLVGGGTRKVNEISPSRRIYTLLPGKHVYEEQTGTTTSNISAGGGFQYAETPGSHTMTFGLSNATSDTHMAGAFIELKQAAGCNSTVTNIEVLMPNIDSGESAVYMYYGNPSASNSASSLTDSSKTLAYKEVSSSSDSTDFGSLSTLSYSHTVTAGTNQTLVVVTDQLKQQSGDVPVDVTSVTYNGKPMVRQVFADGTSTNRNGSTEVWTLLNPDVGNNQVAITLSETNTVLVSAAMTFENTRQNYFPAAGAAFESSSTSFNINITTTKPNTLLAGGGARQRATTAPNATTATVNVTSPGTRVYHVRQANPAIASSISSAGGHQSAVGAGVHTMNLTTSSPSNQFMTGALIALEPESSYDTFSPTSGPATAGEEKGPGPVGYWKFDEGYGTTANNSIANAYNGNISGGLWQTEDMCVNGKCLYFDGSDDVVTVTNAQAIDFDEGLNDGVSASFWVRPLSDGESDTGRIFAKGTRFYCQTENESGGKVDLRCFIDLASTDPAVVVSGALTIGHWHHVLATYGDDGDDDLLIYIDGQLRGTGNGSGSPASGDSDNLLIGGGTSNNFHGFIDDFKIYSYERGEAQARTDAIRGASASGSTASLGIVDTGYLNHGLAGYWKLDHTSGNATDYSGFGRTLTNNGTTTYVTGKFGAGSEHVPASSQHFSTGTTINGIQSVSFWVNPDTTTTYYVSLTSSAYITSSSGTLSATGFTNPRIFVNGVETSTIVADAWQLVTVTTDTPINANQLYLGRQGSNYFDGTFDELRLYNRQIDSGEIAKLYSWAPGPIGYWPMDENTGTVAYDRSGANNSGTITTGNGGWTPGKMGSGYSFDGTSSKILVTDNPALDMIGDFTVSTWVKTNINPINDTYPMIVGKSGGSPQFGYSMWANFAQFSDNWVGQIVVNGSNSPRCDSGVDITDNNWHHLSMTRRGSTVYLYTDGVLSNTCAGSAADISNSVNLGIGAFSNGVTTPYIGLIDDVRLYNYSRTSGQIIEDMNGGHPLGGSPVGSQVLHWKFDELNGSAINNSISSFSSLVGTVTNALWRQVQDCKYYGCLFYDGTGDYVSTPDATALDITGDFSLSAWVNRTSGGGATQAVISKFNAATPSGGYKLAVGNQGEVYCLTANGGSWIESFTSQNLVTTTSGWTHIAAVRSGSTCRVYVNGLDRTTTFATHTTLTANNEAFRVGATADNDQYFYGYIDDVKVYNGALTPDQVKTDFTANSIFNAGTGANERANIVDGDYLSSLIGYWPMDENTGGSGDSSYDKSINSNNGTLGTSMTSSNWTAGKYGSALNFNGTTNHKLDMGDVATYDFGASQNFSVSAWVKSTQSAVASTWPQIVGKEGDGTRNGWLLNLHNGSTSGWYAQIFQGGNNYNTSGTVVNVADGNWHHLMLVRRGSSLEAWTDGKLTNATSVSTGSIANAQSMIVGTDTWSGSEYSGLVDDVKIFNTALTQAQIAYEFNRGAPFAWYRFDECAGTTIYDAGPNAFNGTLTIGASGSNSAVGTCGSGTSTHAWNNGTNGKYGSAMSFDGNDDYINLSNFNVGNNISIASWFYVDDWDIDDGRIISKASGALEEDHIFMLSTVDVSGSKRLRARLKTGACGGSDGNTMIESTTNLSAGQWYHAVVTYDGTTTKFYLDGKYLSSDTTASGNLCSSSDLVAIGRNPGNNSAHWDGLIDDLRVYNYALSDAQVKEIMNHGGVRFE